jgi:AcrR family transcriptional regulator
MSRADDTRCRLIAQARLAFAANGHEGVSIQRDVLTPSGVSNGSFYHQFSDKTDLLLAVLGEATQVGRVVLHEAMTATPAVGPEQRARRAFEAWFDMVDSAEDMFRIQLRERNNPDPRVRTLIQGFRQQWIATIAATLRDGSGSGSADVELTARLITSLTYGILIDYLDTPIDERAVVRATLIDALPRFVAGGVAALDAPGHSASDDPHSDSPDGNWPAPKNSSLA